MANPVTPLTRDQVKLVEDHLGLVKFIARQFRAAAADRRVDRDDVIGEGNLALVNAARTWDPERHGRVVFATHAGHWIRSKIDRMISRSPIYIQSDFATIGDRRPRAPSLEPLFPVTTYFPGSPCPHREAIEDDSVFICMVCHQCGQEKHPGLQRDPQKDPKPEPKPKAFIARLKRKVETRKERRRRCYGEPAVA